MNTRSCKLAALLTCLLLLSLVGGTELWLRSARHQYALNRQLIAALVKGDDNRALVLVNEGADPNTRSTSIPTPSLKQLWNKMFHSLPSPANDSATAFILACGPPWKGDRATYWARRKALDDTHLVLAMLRHGASVTAKNEDGWTPLIAAVQLNRRNTIGVLLLYGADVNATDRNGHAPLSKAIQDYADLNIIRLLLEHGADANTRDMHGRTPLWFAVGMEAAPDRVHLLLEHKASVNSQDEDGLTALHAAILFSHDSAADDIIQQLLAHGAAPDRANKRGETPLMLARDSEHPDFIKALLRRAGAKR